MAAPRVKKKLGELLIESGLITPEAFYQALEAQKGSKKRLGELLVEKGLVTERDIAAALSTQLGLPCVDLKLAPIEQEATRLIPESLARKHLVMPLSLDGSDLHIAMADPFNLEAFQDAQFISGYRLRAYVATRSDILWAINHHYNLKASIESIIEDIDAKSTVEILADTVEESADLEDIRKQSQAAPVIRIVNDLIAQAVERRASDIHLEPKATTFTVRIRVDGVLRVLQELPKWLQGTVTSRIKIMAKMDIAERRVPQDGRVTVRVDNRKLDLRVSTLPANYGEKIVIRILDSGASVITVDKLGMDEKCLSAFISLITKPQGIILVTGPTGSGKSTTLYAALSYINSIERNITTIEDPIEYELPGINQVGVNDKAGRTFASVLRSVLRQDPDVIMVGEMRDLETATIAMQASLTGHLVLSTIHTNNTVATITRLRNLGIPSYLIASTIIGIIAQRLVRVICPFCKTSDKPTEEKLRRIGLSDRELQNATFYRGKGCAECGGTGYRGRVGIYEMLVLSQRIKEYIASEATEATLRQLALAEGMVTLTSAGMEKVLSGITSVDGVMHVNQTEEGFGSTCLGCGCSLSTEFVACPQCGKRLIETCPVCAKIVDPRWSYCPYCAETLHRPASQHKDRKMRYLSVEKERAL